MLGVLIGETHEATWSSITGDYVMKILSKKEVRARCLYSYAHIARLEKANLFPKRIQLGANRVGWYEHEIDEWIASRPRAS